MQNSVEDIFDFKNITDDCIKCGKCIPVCTIHGVNADEVTSPRGFLELLGAYERGDLELDKTAKDIFESCFLCTACVEVCPKSLPTDMVIEQVRSDIAKKYGIAWYKKAFFMLLRHRWMNDLAFKLGWVFQTCGFKIQKDIDSMSSRFELPMLKTDRLLPSLKRVSFLNAHRQKINNGGKRKVMIFIGCLANYNYRNIGDSLLEILKVLQIDAYLAKEQKCCSAPAYFTGDFDTVDHNAKFNIEYFEKVIEKEGVEAIIVPEATCSAMLKIDYAHYFHDQPEWKARAEALSDKIFMATEWLYKHTELESILDEKGRGELNVTYHDPCHAKKMQGIHEEPRELLSKNYNMVEMSDSNACCGFGGVTMQSEKYHFAKAVGASKAAMIKNTKAEIVSAECSACRMQINASMNYEGVESVFKNPIELIAEALRK